MGTLLCVWKIDPKILRSEKKSVGAPTPPPPPPSHHPFPDLRHFRGWRQTDKRKLCVPVPPPPPMVWFGLTPMGGGLGAHRPTP